MEEPGILREPNPRWVLSGSLCVNRFWIIACIWSCAKARSVVGQLWIGLQLLGDPLPQSRARNRGSSARDLVGVDVPRLAPPFEPALYGRQGDSEELCDSLLGIPRSMAQSTFSLRSFSWRRSHRHYFHAG
jgi:hypothetical protein